MPLRQCSQEKQNPKCFRQHLLIVCLESAILLLLLGFVDGFERRQVFYFVPRKVLGGVCFGFVMRWCRLGEMGGLRRPLEDAFLHLYCAFLTLLLEVLCLICLVPQASLFCRKFAQLDSFHKSKFQFLKFLKLGWNHLIFEILAKKFLYFSYFFLFTTS